MDTVPKTTNETIASSDELAVRLEKITKRFPGIIANNEVSFEVRKGEIHALLGENGAGKSTLMSILAGLYQPDSGQIFVREKSVTFRSPADAIEAGVGMVWQHFKLVATQTVAENVALGLRRPRLRLGLKEVEKKLGELSVRYGLEIKPNLPVSSLSVGEQQRVEIVKTLYFGAEILILDEPTASLTPQETDSLFKIMRNLAAEGYAIIFISHKLAEIQAVANRATVLRKGKTVETVSIKGGEAERAYLANLMMGEEISADAALTAAETGLSTVQIEQGSSSIKEEVLLRIQSLTVHNDQGIPAVKDCSLQVRAGEIVAVVGIAGNGQRELVEGLAGLRKIVQGRLYLAGKDITQASVRTRLKLGLALVPEDRLNMGAAAGLDMDQNFILRNYWQPQLRLGPFLRRKFGHKQLMRAVNDYDIRVGSLNAPARLLSGGNLQKLLLAREIGLDPQVLIVANPSRGLDLGATRYVRKRLIQQCQKGTAILLITEDLDEALIMGDRLLVIHAGVITGETDKVTAKKSLQQIGLWMTGAR